MDLGQIVQFVLFATFVLLTAALTAAIQPTYNNLLVPELGARQLYPSLAGPANGGPTYLVDAAHYSTYLLANLVDPAIALVAVGLGLVYLSRAVWSRSGLATEGLLPRFLVAIVVANFTVPIAAGLIDLGGITYPTIVGWDGGAWQNWANLAGFAEVGFSAQNGLLAFVLAFVQFSLVFLLAIVVGVRDASLAVLLVVLPIFTLLWPIGPFAGLARRGWLLFIEFVFLPCVLVVPLELAVQSPDPILLVAYLTLALSSPYLISVAGTHLSNLGFPSSGSALSGGVERGLAAATRTTSGASMGAGRVSAASGGGGSIASALGGSARAAGGAAIPAAAPILVASALGAGARHLVAHVQEWNSQRQHLPPKIGPFPPGGTGGHGR